MDDIFKERMLKELLNDSVLNLRQRGKDLHGTCPQCGEKEVFISASQPWRLQCRRFNNCDYSEKTADRYPQVFAKLETLTPPTKADPNVPATTYLTQIRKFDPKVIGNFHKFSKIKRGENDYISALEFPLFNGGSWKRVLNEADVSDSVAKSKINGKYQGLAWAPNINNGDGLCKEYIETNDKIVITEGIFKSLAWLHVKDFSNKPYKAIASLSSSNLPAKVFQANQDKNIQWILAIDNDAAGRKQAEKFIAYMKKYKQKFLVCIPPDDRDWDDLYRDNNLDASFINDCHWRGLYEYSRSLNEKAVLTYLKCRKKTATFALHKATWSYKLHKGIEHTEIDELHALEKAWEKGGLPQLVLKFNSMSRIFKIANHVSKLLYNERDPISDDQWRTFEFVFENNSPRMVLSFDGGVMESKSSYNKLLLSKTSCGVFDGEATDLKDMRTGFNGWLTNRIDTVRTLPFLGYDKETATYVFPTFGFHKNRMVKQNKSEFLDTSTAVKTHLRSYDVESPGIFDPQWMSPFKRAFGLNGLSTLAWWTGTLFAEQIRKNYKSWTFCELTGEQGAGKSTLIEFLWRCIGFNDQEGFDPSKSTNVGVARKMEQFANLPVVFLEFDRSDGTTGTNRSRFEPDTLKTAYNGRGIRTKGSKKGAETIEPPFRGGVMLSQNATVDGSEALKSRICHFHCTKEHFTKQTEEDARYLNRLETCHVSGFLKAVLTNADHYYKVWETNFLRIRDEFHARGEIKQNRIVLNHAQIAAWMYPLQELFGKDQISDADIKATVDHLYQRGIDREGRLNSDHPFIAAFWDIYDFCNTRNASLATSGEEVINQSTDPNMIAINLNHMQMIAAAANQTMPPLTELKKILPLSRKYKFITKKKVRNAKKELKHCWLFEKATRGK